MEKNIYKEALVSQDACNSSGLIHALAEALDAIWKEANEQGKGTDYVNSHPVVRLYLEQLTFLCHRDYSEAYKICKEGACDQGCCDGTACDNPNTADDNSIVCTGECEDHD